VLGRQKISVRGTGPSPDVEKDRGRDRDQDDHHRADDERKVEDEIESFVHQESIV
jgi:hypothetical protein